MQSERAFTADEEEKLQGALQLEPKELELVINTTTFILQQAAYHLAKPTVLKTHLASIGLDEEKVGWGVDVSAQMNGMWWCDGPLDPSLHPRLDVSREGSGGEAQVLNFLPQTSMPVRLDVVSSRRVICSCVLAGGGELEAESHHGTVGEVKVEAA